MVEDKAERVRRFQAATVNALWDIAAQWGLNRRGRSSRTTSTSASTRATDSIDRIYKFYERGVLLEDPIQSQAPLLGDGTPRQLPRGALDQADFRQFTIEFRRQIGEPVAVIDAFWRITIAR